MGIGQGVAAFLLLCILIPSGFFRNRERIIRPGRFLVEFPDAGRIVHFRSGKARLLRIKGICITGKIVIRNAGQTVFGVIDVGMPAVSRDPGIDGILLGMLKQTEQMVKN